MSEQAVKDALAHAEDARMFEPESLRETSRDLIVLADEVLRLREELGWKEALINTEFG